MKKKNYMYSYEVAYANKYYSKQIVLMGNCYNEAGKLWQLYYQKLSKDFKQV